MEEVNVSGKIYISSKRAADLCGYAQDYIGQLARRGVIDSQRIGGLWYVSLESIRVYKERAEQYKPEPPKYKPQQIPDSIVGLDGKEYISVGRASEISHYNPDYIGQLARNEKIPSQQVGNRWYIDKDALLAHKTEKDGLLAAVQAQSVGLLKSTNENRSSSSAFSPLLTYAPDRRDLMPQLVSHSTIVLEKHTARPSPDTHQIPIRVINSDIKKSKEIFEEEVEEQENFVSRFMFLIPRISIFTGPYLKTAFALVIVLTIGISVSKSDLIYAVLPKNAASKNALANVATGFSDRVGGVFGPFLAKELVYQRAE